MAPYTTEVVDKPVILTISGGILAATALFFSRPAE